MYLAIGSAKIRIIFENRGRCRQYVEKREREDLEDYADKVNARGVRAFTLAFLWLDVEFVLEREEHVSRDGVGVAHGASGGVYGVVHV